MKRSVKWLLLGLCWGCLLMAFGWRLTPVAAASQRVLLVYDSKNTVANGTAKIDTVQRALTSLNLKVRTVSQNQYHKGMLTQAYAGVVTMVNWPEVGLTNQTFIHDRDQFQGAKLHIGDNLTATEAQALGAQKQKVYLKQFTLKAQQASQQLPFSETMTVLTQTHANSTTFGTLATQEKDAATYAYGTVYQHNGYLPDWRNNGLSLTLAVQTMAQVFQRHMQQQPMLTITNVTPYSHLTLLAHLSQYCENHNIPFAVSTTTVAQNTTMAAYKRFTKALRNVENHNGVVYLQTPAVGNPGAYAQPQRELQNLISNELVAFAQNNVFPVGISSQGYWNQDRVYRQNFLTKTNSWLLLPDHQPTTFIHEDQQGTAVKQSFLAVSASSFNTVKSLAQVQFAAPTALTVKLPATQAKLQAVERQITGLNVTWYQPAGHLDTTLQAGAVKVSYRDGQYFLNGRPKMVNDVVKQNFKQPTYQHVVRLKGFFKVQGMILTVLFSVIFVILIGFIWLGRKIYRNKYYR